MIDVYVFNSLSGKRELLKSLNPGKINMYVCGMTVYDYCHIGHARVMVFFDVVVRMLRHIGYEVNYWRNITDVDDKIIKRAQEVDQEIGELTQYFIQAMQEDEAELLVLPPDESPRATEYIDQMISMISLLVDKDYAYVSDSGDVLFSVEHFDKYGALAHQKLDQLYESVRKDIADDKRSPLDFVLWKLAKSNEPSWESPWGAGRPGWHIECSVMAANLAESVDIHGGGVDLKFPHHENEIAQSECANGELFVKYWMHVGHVQVDHQKMSKSVGNFYTIRDLLEVYPGQVLRMFLLTGHYRSPAQFSHALLDQAGAALERLYLSLCGVKLGELASDCEYFAKFMAAMADDFNTPKALAVCFELSHLINQAKVDADTNLGRYAASLGEMLDILGLGQVDISAFMANRDAVDAELVKAAIAERERARDNQDWQMADKIRDDLLADHSVLLEDGADGTTWRVVRRRGQVEE